MTLQQRLPEYHASHQLTIACLPDDWLDWLYAHGRQPLTEEEVREFTKALCEQAAELYARAEAESFATWLDAQDPHPDE